MTQTSRKSLQFLSWGVAIALGLGGYYAARVKTQAESQRDIELARKSVALVESQRKLVEAKLASRAAEDSALMVMRESAGHGYMELDKAGRVDVWNPALAAWTGYSESEMKGHTLAKVMDPDDYAKHSAAYPRWIQAEDSKITTLRLECRLLAKDGKKIPVIVTARKVPVVEGVGDQLPKAIGLIDRPKTVLDLTQ